MSAQPRDEPRPTRRGLLLGVGLAGVGGTLAGCGTAAVPYGANEAGVVPQDGPAPSSMAMAPSPAASSSMATQGGTAPARKRERATVTGTVLGAAREIPVGGGMIFTTARVVVTQPARGQYRAFSAVCTHVGCILNQVTGGTIDCPCHGSRFTITSGAVVGGPAPTPLPKKQIKIVDGMVVLT
ncbi:MAG TPA: Rieske (2Fe-2S) protein [Streptosporangiaceae bacterium]